MAAWLSANSGVLWLSLVCQLPQRTSANRKEDLSFPGAVMFDLENFCASIARSICHWRHYAVDKSVCVLTSTSSFLTFFFSLFFRESLWQVLTGRMSSHSCPTNSVKALTSLGFILHWVVPEKGPLNGCVCFCYPLSPTHSPILWAAEGIVFLTCPSICAFRHAYPPYPSKPDVAQVWPYLPLVFKNLFFVRRAFIVFELICVIAFLFFFGLHSSAPC